MTLTGEKNIIISNKLMFKFVKAAYLDMHRQFFLTKWFSHDCIVLNVVSMSTEQKMLKGKKGCIH